jgi:pyruvate/2-oxoglutarate dehydrogenase complex dihydrolipoamide acyltransferase (E2) component
MRKRLRQSSDTAALPRVEVLPFPQERKLIVDIGRATRSRRTISGFIKADVTDLRRRLHGLEATTGEETSLTAVITACVGRAVAEHRHVHALRNVRGRLVRYDDVDVNVSVEVELDGHSFPLNHVVRAADKRSVTDISREIRRIKRYPTESSTLRLASRARKFLLLPAAFRALAFRALYRLPARQKALTGTVGITAVGMFGRGGGWGTAFQVHPLEIVVGGIAVEPGFENNEVCPREHLHLTLSFDHDIVDGAPAVRFVTRLRELIEGPSDVLG